MSLVVEYNIYYFRYLTSLIGNSVDIVDRYRFR